MEIVDKPRGTGRVFLNAEVLLEDVRYQITVWQNPDGGDLQVDGRLDIDYQAALRLLESQQPLTLQLEDGRDFGFRVLSTTGRISGGSADIWSRRELQRTGIICPTCGKALATAGHIGAEGLTMNCPACGHRWATVGSA